MACSKCGGAGHNSRRCSASQEPIKSPLPKKGPAEPKQKTCGNCGEVGHNRRSCTASEAPAPPKAPRASEPPPAAKQRTCGNCGEVGHNRRSCTASEAPEPAPPTPAPRTPPPLVAKIPTPAPRSVVAETPELALAFRTLKPRRTEPKDYVLKPETKRKRYSILRAKVSDKHPIGKEPHLRNYSDKEGDHRRFGVKDIKTQTNLAMWFDILDPELATIIPGQVLEGMRFLDEVRLTRYMVWRMS